jgi:hypothetical protein
MEERHPGSEPDETEQSIIFLRRAQSKKTMDQLSVENAVGSMDKKDKIKKLITELPAAAEKKSQPD